MKIETRKGLWVSSFFTETFGNKDIKPAKAVPSFKKLERHMSDDEIQKETGAQECSLEDVAALLKSPPKGTDDGYWNIFYVGGLVVGVGWDADFGRWRVYAWRRGDRGWDAGRRVFSGNWPSDTQSSEFESLNLRIEKLEKIIDGMREVFGV